MEIKNPTFASEDYSESVSEGSPANESQGKGGGGNVQSVKNKAGVPGGAFDTGGFAVEEDSGGLAHGDEAELRAKLDKIIRRAAGEMAAKMPPKLREMSEDELLHAVLSRPALLRSLYAANVRAAVMAGADAPRFSTLYARTPANPKSVPKTLSEATEEVKKIFHLS